MTNANDTNIEQADLIERSISNIDAILIVDERLQQLSGMMKVCCSEDFHQYDEQTKNNYLWACATMVEQAQEASIKLSLANERVKK